MRGGYAVGSFSPRTTAMIRPILRAGQDLRSPLIVQVSQKELARYQVTPQQFAEAFFAQLAQEGISVPVVLHLDHTKEFSIDQEAIAARFSSVMIDASDKALDGNIAVTKHAVDYAHSRGVSVEAELGRIGTADLIETDRDEELYTKPEEAECFVRETGMDALGRDQYLTDAEMNALSPEEKELAREAVEGTVSNKTVHFLGSSQKVPEGAHER